MRQSSKLHFFSKIGRLIDRWYICCAGVCVFLIPSSCFAQNSDITINPTTWKINKDIVINSSGKPLNIYIADILERLEKPEGDGVPVSRHEFIRYLERHEIQTVYHKQLINYATPKSIEIQTQTHDDFTKIFMTEKRISAGITFIKRYKSLLSGAQREYGVAMHDIVSILMWESRLGEFTGKFRIFNIFMAQILFLDHAQKYAIQEMVAAGEANPLRLSINKKKEKKRFDRIKKRAVNSIVSLMRQCKAVGTDPLEQFGSWGGAIGYVQFMPFNMYLAVDADGDGRIDLFSWPDAIYSAANYLKVKGNYELSYQGRRKAIFSYNHDDSYVAGVIKYADEINRRYKHQIK